MQNIEIEREYQQLVEAYRRTEKTSKESGIHNVVQLLLDHPEKIWWFAWELIGKVTSQGGYLSHRAPARASDLVTNHPMVIEDRKIGRFAVYRLRRENMQQISQFLGGITGDKTVLARYQSESVPGTFNCIRSAGGRLICTCKSFLFGGGQECKHIKRYTEEKVQASMTPLV